MEKIINCYLNFPYNIQKHIQTQLTLPIIIHQGCFNFKSMFLTRHVFPSNSRTLSTFTTHIHLQQPLLQMALHGFNMKFENYNAILNECVNKRAFREGQRVHAHMIKTRYLPSVFLRTRLIVLYTKCDSLGHARNVFDEMPERNVVSWTAMISAYSQRGYASQALNLFLQMLKSGIYILEPCLKNKLIKRF